MSDTSTADRSDVRAAGSRRGTRPQRGRARPKRGRKPRRAIWTWLFPTLIVGLALAIPYFIWYAADAIYTSTDGELQTTVTDPTAAGYQASVIPSPSHLLLVENAEGGLALAAVMSIGADGQGGTMVLLPGETVGPSGERLIDAYDRGGTSSTTDQVEGLIGVRVDDVTDLDADAWTSLVEPVGPVPVALTERLVVVDEAGETTVGWEAGDIEVPAELGAAFLGWLNPDEDAFNRVLRQEHYVEAWLAAIAASDDPGVVPGETDSGLGRFVRAIAVRPVVVTPSVTSVLAADDMEGLEVDRDEVRDVVYDMIPFPVPADREAPKVRLLDGTGRIALATDVAPSLVRAGAHIVLIGNANEFGVPRTTVTYHDDQYEEIAGALAEAIGADATEFAPLEDTAIDITVIVGEDHS